MLDLKCCVPASACFETFPVFLKLLNWCKVAYQAVPGNYSDRKAVSKLVVCTKAWTSLPRQANVSPAKGGISKKSLAPLAVSQSVRPSDVRSSWRLWTGPKRQINWDPFLNSSSLQQTPCELPLVAVQKMSASHRNCRPPLEPNDDLRSWGSSEL